MAIWTIVKKAAIDAAINMISNQGYTPHIIIYVDHPDYEGAKNESSYIRLSIGVNAVLDFKTTDSTIEFTTSVGGVAYSFVVPYDAISEVSTKEDESLYWGFEVNVEEDHDRDHEGTTICLADSHEGDHGWINPEASSDWYKKATIH